MPRVDDTAGVRFYLPGVYEKLLVGGCQRRCRPHCHRDPRLSLQELSAEQAAVLDWLAAQCDWEASLDRGERLAAGEPYVVSSLCFGGHSIPREDSWPTWLRDHFGGVKSVRVHADDTVTPIYDNN